MAVAPWTSQGWTRSTSRPESISDGTLAPAMVIQKTAVSSRSIRGKPKIRLVTRRSRVRRQSKRARSPVRMTARSASRAASA